MSTKFTLNASTPLLTGKVDTIATYWYKFLNSLVPGGKSIQVPLTGFSITIGSGIDTLLLNPAGTLATGTIIMPPDAIDNDRVRISSTQTITALTVNGNKGQLIKNAPTALTVSTTASYCFEFVYDANSGIWWRVQ